jgi:hypothetical protein
MSKEGAQRQIGKLTFNIEPDALKEIISQGRLSEFSSVAAAEAAVQITAQIVDRVAAAALDPNKLNAPTEFGVEYAFDEVGGFGFPRPKPHVPVVVIINPPPNRI